MKITNLPDAIFPGAKDEPILFHDYSAPVGSFKGKSILHKNAISMVISGEKTMYFAEKSVFITDEEFHMLSAGNCLASMDLSDKPVFHSILIFFDSRVLSDFYLKYNKRISELTGTRTITAEPYLAFRKDAFVRNYIASLQLLFQSGGTIPEEMKRLKFEELMLHLLQHHPEQLLAFQPKKASQFDELGIRKAVETNITNSLSIEELAFLCNMSVSTFKRQFTQLYGTSPGKWILQQRMELAKNLLQFHHEKPGEVFYKVGYENHSSFSESFRQMFGMTPREFQQQLTVRP